MRRLLIVVLALGFVGLVAPPARAVCRVTTCPKVGGDGLDTLGHLELQQAGRDQQVAMKAKKPSRKLKAMITRSHKNPRPSPM